MVCLDTTVLIDLSGRGGRRALRGVRSKLEALLEKDESLMTTRFNVAELWVGVARSARPADERRAIAALLRPLAILEFGAAAARVFGRIVGHLQAKGEPIGDLDALIAAVAVVHGQSILTRNEAHFARVPGLAVETY